MVQVADLLRTPHWSTEIPMESPHVRLPAFKEKGFVVLSDLDPPIPDDQFLSLEYMDWKSGGDTNFAPIATADGQLDCQGFWKPGEERADKGGILTSNAERCPAIVEQVKAVGADFGRVRVIKLEPQSYEDALRHIHRDDNNRFNPDNEGWVVRQWIELTDNPGAFMVLMEQGDDGLPDQSTESHVPMHRGARYIVDTQRLWHVVCNPSNTTRYALISSFESGPALDAFIQANLPGDATERGVGIGDTVEHDIVIIGAGPAGLTAAYMLTKRGVQSTVLEADTIVGGISRTPERDGWRFDIGGHRFFTKVQPVEDLWFEILGPDDFLKRPRLSRIYYRGKFYDYPISAMNALRNLGPIEALRCVGSYAWVRIRKPKDTSTLEGFVASRFGWRLYRHFFKTQSEKVWGVPCTEIQADWGAQRIKNLSLVRAVREALKPKRLRRNKDKSKQVTSLIEEFNYPKYGPGMMWERCTELITAKGTKVTFDSNVTKIEHAGGRATAVTAVTDGVPTRYPCTDVISSMPIGALLRAMDPPVPQDVIAAADALRYRDFITVALVVPEEDGFPDNWIYINDATVSVGRIQNFGRWSPYLVKDGKTCLGLEFFVFEGDDMWTKADADLIEQGKRELHEIGLLSDVSRVEAGYVVRMPKAYPMYDAAYKENVQTLADWLSANTPNVHPVGRNGMHRYNNQDHSMYTAMLSVENIFGANHDVWNVNVEEEYHEEKVATPDPHPNQ